MGKKTYYVHLNWSDYPGKTSKLSIPSKWDTTKPVEALIELFVDAYNAKNPENKIDVATVHLESQNDGQGEKVYSDAIIGDVLGDRNDYYITPGALTSPVATAVKGPQLDADGVPMPRCKNYGCQKYYSEKDNTETSCHHHVLPPYFHDTVKGWQCCRDTKAFDWEEFQAIPGCKVGKHSTVDPGVAIALSAREAAGRDMGATNGNGESQEAAPTTVLRSIEAFDAENPDAATAAGAAKKMMSAPRKSTRNADGTAKCQRKGCGISFVVADNSPSKCMYHAGQPVFHDALKFWSCCPDQKKMDFDDFLKVPGCATGFHDDGVIDL